jgi:hypothetical protein
MLMRLLRAAFAVLVAVMLGCMPTLALASPATASPPYEDLFVVSAALASVEIEQILEWIHTESMDADTGKIALTDMRSSTVLEAPAYPLLE